jgi:mannose-1-phosphate guanylyltransferase/mannose-6-phosphate isomerase
MISVILAGGKGLRLWPESRRQRPKQLCSFVDNKSMLDHTIDRLMASGSRRIIIITSDDLLPNIRQVINNRKDSELIEILSEPEGKNTAPAVGLALSMLYKENPDEILGIFPADHHVLDTPAFSESIQRAALAAQHDHLATIGISPVRPETGFGYIEKTKWEIGEIPGVFQVSTFCEKPDAETAKSYLGSGQHMWNAGIYMGKAAVLAEEFQKHLPEIYVKLILGHEEYIKSYSELPNISLDYGIAEKSERMAVVPANFGWCDLGSWNALADLHEQDDMSNVFTGNDVILMDSKNCIVKQAEKTLVLFGVENLLVVETDDVILVSERNRSQEVRKIVELLDKENRFDLL